MTRLRIGTAASLPVLTFLLSFLFAVSAVSQEAATVPAMVKFSGTVHDAKSRILGATFALYKEEQGGAPLWLETQNVSLDSSGHYNVQLGATLSKGLPKELFTSGEARWLGVQAEGQAEQPRVLLLSVPYALKAADAETIGGLPPSAFVLARSGASQTTAVKKKASAARPSSPTPNVQTNVTTSGGTANTLPLFSTGTDIENSVVTQSGTSVGINTAAPAATLDVNGTANVRGNLSSTAFVNSASGYEIGGSLFAFAVGQQNSNSFFGSAGNPATTGGFNIGTGFQALHSVTSGTWNTATGATALASNTTGSYNTALGEEALSSNTSGTDNTALGLRTLDYNRTGSYNTAVGEGSLLQDTGNYNSGFGYYALQGNTAGTYNTGAGFGALYNNVTGNYNSALGYQAGTDSGVTISNATAIGAFADVKASNSMVLGSIAGVNFALADTNVGIGITAPTAKLHIGSPSGGAATTGLRIEGPSRSGTGAFAASMGGFGDFDVDAPGIVGGRFTVKENGRVGIGTASPDNTLSVNGTADKTGGGSWAVFSDRRLKNLNGNFNSGLRQVLRINPIRYRYKEANGMDIHDTDEHIGLVAQEVQKVIPEAVMQNGKGYLLVNNDPIIWAMLNAIKEQQQQIQKQRALVRTQAAAIRNLNAELRETRQSVLKIKAQIQTAQPTLLAKQ